MLEQLQLAHIFVEFLLRKSESFAVDASRLQESISLVHKDRMIHWDRKLDVAGMARAGGLVQITCCAPKIQLASC